MVYRQRCQNSSPGDAFTDPQWSVGPCVALKHQALMSASLLFQLHWIIAFRVCLLPTTVSSCRLSLYLPSIYPSCLAQWLTQRRCIRFEEQMNKWDLLNLFWRPRALHLKPSRNQAEDDFVPVQYETFLSLTVVRRPLSNHCSVFLMQKQIPLASPAPRALHIEECKDFKCVCVVGRCLRHPFVRLWKSVPRVGNQSQRSFLSPCPGPPLLPSRPHAGSLGRSPGGR